MKTHRLVELGLLGIGMCAIGCAAAPPRQPPQATTVPAALVRPARTVAQLSDTVRAVLSAALADSAFPGAIAVVGGRGGELVEVAVGRLTWGEPARVDRHTLWDLASLTKVVGTTTGIMRLVDEHRVDVDAPVQKYLPDWIGPGKDQITVRHLLTHSSGLPSFKPYDQITTNRDSIDRLMFGTPLDSAPGRAMIYSDIGGYLLGKIIERVSGQALDVFLEQSVFKRAGMLETQFTPEPALWPTVAPTEIDPKRGGLVRGKVHDERAYYLGGVSGHAGLFSTADDLSRYAQTLIRGGHDYRGTDHLAPDRAIVSPATLERFTAYADSTFSNRGLGWQKPSLPGMRFSTAGPWASSTKMSTASYGHTGFTGTSILIDPVNDVYIILLSNRVNPTRNNSKIGGVRTRLTDAVYGVLKPTVRMPP